VQNLADDPKHAYRLSEMLAEVDGWMKEQGDTGRVYGTPRLLKNAPDRK
jgi:hypothetical protein